MDFVAHDTQSAPQDAAELLSQSQEEMGFIPNMYRHMADAPPLLKAYKQMSQLFSQTSLSEAEQQVVLLAASVENRCDFCTKAHSKMAAGAGVSEDDVSAIREGGQPGDSKLAALAQFTKKMVAERAWLAEADMQALLQAGYERPQILEVVLGVGMKTLSNYTNHIAQTDVNPELDS